MQGIPAEKIDHYMKDMLNKCKRIQPEYLPIIEVADYKEKKFIVIWAPGGYLRPYSSPKSMAKSEKERVYYIRKMASTIAPSEEEKRDLYNLANNVPFDDRINHEADRFFNYPYASVEESLCNAAYHKGYDVREPIEVRILPNRIEIVSHPGADRSITEEGLRTYRVFNRRYRNRRIGEFLKEMHLTEGRNTGFRKILNALEQNGSPKPVFETDPERLSFCTTLLIHPHFLHQDESRNDIVNGTNDTVNEISKLTKTEQAVLSYIENNNQVTIDKITSVVGKSKSTINRTIKSLKAKGVLTRTGSDKAGFWNVKKDHS